MTAQGPEHTNGKDNGQLRRRGLVAAVAALAAGTLAKTTATPALAGTDGDVVLGATNTESTTTRIRASTIMGGAVIFVAEGTTSTSANYVDGVHGLSHTTSGFG